MQHKVVLRFAEHLQPHYHGHYGADATDKEHIPKYIFPLEKCCFAMVNCICSFVALLLVMIFTGAPFHLTIFEAVSYTHLDVYKRQADRHPAAAGTERNERSKPSMFQEIGRAHV